MSYPMGIADHTRIDVCSGKATAGRLFAMFLGVVSYKFSGTMIEASSAVS